MLKKPSDLPVSAGVYIFKDKSGEVIYVGKAKNLKNRVTSYFSSDLLHKTRQMIENAHSLSTISVASEFEALMLEANLVKKYNPKYNIELKDGKSPLYIGVTKDLYPRVITFRKKEIGKLKLKIYFGPFLSGLTARKILRRTRKVFPFATHFPTKKICIYSQIGLCKPCPSEIEIYKDPTPPRLRGARKKYLRNIRKLKMLLGGNVNLVREVMEKEMQEYSNQEKFEDAKEISLQINALENIARSEDVNGYLENPNFLADVRKKELDNLKKILQKYFDVKKLIRIECFDIAHFAGLGTAASMVTFINGEAEKKYYRHFKIYGTRLRGATARQGNSDVDSMKEVLTRRMRHLDPPSQNATARQGWGRPDLIIVDGGKPQVSAASEILKSSGIPIIGLAKRFETIVIKADSGFVEIKARGEALKLLQRIRDEAHRFARRLHHKQLRDSMKLA